MSTEINLTLTKEDSHFDSKSLSQLNLENSNLEIYYYLANGQLNTDKKIDISNVPYEQLPEQIQNCIYLENLNCENSKLRNLVYVDKLINLIEINFKRTEICTCEALIGNYNLYLKNLKYLTKINCSFVTNLNSYEQIVKTIKIFEEIDIEIFFEIVNF